MSKMTIVRHGQPSKMDTAEYGSQCIVRQHDEDSYTLYVQVSKKEEEPHWELVGMFTQKSDPYYINQLISMRLGI